MSNFPEGALVPLEKIQLPQQWHVPLQSAETPMTEQFTSSSGGYAQIYKGASPQYSSGYAPTLDKNGPITSHGPSPDHIESSGYAFVDNAERLFNKYVGPATETAIVVKDAVYDTLNIPHGSHDPSLSTALLAGAVWIGARKIHRDLKNWLNETLSSQDKATFSDKREKMSRQLLVNRKASVDDILKVSFGEWPPKGLDIYGANAQQVRLNNSVPPKIQTRPWQLKQKFMDIIDNISGNATTSGERLIRVNTIKLSILPAFLKESGLSATLGHEGVHILQGDHALRSPEIFGTDVAKLLRHEAFLPAGQGFISEIPRRYVAANPSEYISEKLAKVAYYTLEKMEIQSRLHELLAEGYQRWGVLPQNREQFVAAMANSGLAMPDKILTDLSLSSTISETRSIFVKDHTKPFGNAVIGINNAYFSLTEEGTAYFWEQYMPRIYCNLIEMYGDRLGRERFGLGKNIHHQFRLHAAGQPSDVPEMLKSLPPEKVMAEPDQTPLASANKDHKSEPVRPRP